MEKKLQEFLRPGEQVCWQGQPGPFGLMEGSCKKQILCKWGVAVVIIGLLLWSYITFNTNPSVGFVAMVLLVGVIILASPLAEQRSLRGVRYWITDQRAIMMTRDTICYGMELDSIDAWKQVRGMTEWDCLVLGSELFGEVKKQLRWRALHPKVSSQEGTGRVEGMILYGLRDADDAAALLRMAAAESKH